MARRIWKKELTLRWAIEDFASQLAFTNPGVYIDMEMLQQDKILARKLREDWMDFIQVKYGRWHFDNGAEELWVDHSWGEWCFPGKTQDDVAYFKEVWRQWLKTKEVTYGPRLEERLQEVEKKEREEAKELFEVRQAWNNMMRRRYGTRLDRSSMTELLFRRCRPSDPVWHPQEGEEPAVTAERTKLIACIRHELKSEMTNSKEGAAFVLLRIAKDNIQVRRHLERLDSFGIATKSRSASPDEDQFLSCTSDETCSSGSDDSTEEEESWSEGSDPTTEVSTTTESDYDSDPIVYLSDPDLPGKEELRNAWIALKRQYRPDLKQTASGLPRRSSRATSGAAAAVATCAAAGVTDTVE
jgi:hypothetical protein